MKSAARFSRPAAAAAGLLLAFVQVDGVAAQVGDPAHSGGDKGSPSSTAPIGGEAPSDLPRLIAIPGAERLGFSRAGAYEITWLEYARAVRNGGCRPPVGYVIEPPYSVSRWVSERTTADDERFDTTLPVTGVNGEDIDCYLRWLNRETGRDFRLPNTAQWQWLAYGAEQRLFPWGEEVGFDRANVYAGGRYLFDVDRLGRPQTLTTLLPVGRFAPNMFGLYDVIGNASEYVGDCEPRALGPSSRIRSSCVVMGAYSPPVFDDPRLPARRLLWEDGAGMSVGFRIIE